MTIREYLEATQHHIFEHLPKRASGYIVINLYMFNTGQMMWGYDLENVYREAGIYRCKEGSKLVFRAIPISYFTNVCPEGGTPTAEDLIDELYYENWDQVQRFSTIVETIQHYYDLISDLPRGGSIELNWGSNNWSGPGPNYPQDS